MLCMSVSEVSAQSSRGRLENLLSRSEQRLLRKAIIRELGDPDEHNDGAPIPLRYTGGRFDLNGDGRDEVLVWVPTLPYGGTSGYPLLIFARGRNGYRLLRMAEALWTPLIVLNSSRHGWRDIVMQRGGGGEEMHHVIFRHDGRSYPKEPRPFESRRVRGRQLIGKDWSTTLFGPLPAR
jgi:hypothetical protein